MIQIFNINNFILWEHHYHQFAALRNDYVMLSMMDFLCDGSHDLEQLDTMVTHRCDS